MKFTDLTITKLPFSDRRKSYWDDDLPTFGIRCGNKTKTWVLAQHNRYHVIGRYPQVGLKTAREEAKRRLALKFFPDTGLGTQEAIRLYLEAKKPSLKASSHYRFAFHLNRDFTFTKPINQISRAEINAVLNKLKPSQANTAHTIFKAFLNWCVEQGLLTTNPIAALKRPHKTSKRDRLLTDHEIKLIWQESFKHNSFGQLVRCLLLSAQRLSQFKYFNPAWVQGDTIVFPAQIMKNGEQMTLPITVALRRNLPQAPLRGNINELMKKFRNALPQISHYTLHDARRYFSSTCAKIRIPIDITESILAHKTGSRTPIQRVYDHFDRLEPMREALEKYEAHLAAIVPLT